MNSEVVLAPTSAFIALALRSTQTGRHDSFTGPPTGNCTVTGMLLGPLPQIPQPAQAERSVFVCCLSGCRVYHWAVERVKQQQQQRQRQQQRRQQHLLHWLFSTYSATD